MCTPLALASCSAGGIFHDKAEKNIKDIMKYTLKKYSNLSTLKYSNLK